MDKLWAPWRINYLKAKKSTTCIFCEAARGKKKNTVIFKKKNCLCLLNIFPYNNGHIMVSPLRHVGELSDLTDTETLEVFKTVASATKLLDTILQPDGYNIGINLSEFAGAGIPGHLHIHIVPRWKGDTNFMPVIANTKIISQSLKELFTLLKNAYAKTN
ncbi:MAG: HIT domain-containing protein [Candidatus Omnitrophota bacterium]|jgi:ATP adenylyltransferase